MVSKGIVISIETWINDNLPSASSNPCLKEWCSHHSAEPECCDLKPEREISNRLLAVKWDKALILKYVGKTVGWKREDKEAASTNTPPLQYVPGQIYDNTALLLPHLPFPWCVKRIWLNSIRHLSVCYIPYHISSLVTQATCMPPLFWQQL